MTSKPEPLEFHVDFMGGRIEVGSTVIAVRVPDRTPQMYTGVVEAIRKNQKSWGDREFVQIKVLPTGGYSTRAWRHGSFGSTVVKGNWIQAENVLKFP